MTVETYAYNYKCFSSPAEWFELLLFDRCPKPLAMLSSKANNRAEHFQEAV